MKNKNKQKYIDFRFKELHTIKELELFTGVTLKNYKYKDRVMTQEQFRALCKKHETIIRTEKGLKFIRK